MTVEEIIDAVKELSEEDMQEFKYWYEEFEAKKWDDQFDDGELDESDDEILEN